MNDTQARFTALKLGIPGFTYGDLYEPDRLKDLLSAFDRWVQARDAALFAEYAQYRQGQGEGMTAPAISALLVRLAPHVGAFLSRLFRVEPARAAQIRATQAELDSVFVYRHEIVDNLKVRFKGVELLDWDVPALARRFDALVQAAADPDLVKSDYEGAVSWLAVTLLRLSADPSSAAEHAGSTAAALRARLQADPVAKALWAKALEREDAGLVAALLEDLWRWSYAALHDPGLNAQVAGWVSFKVPEKTAFDRLVEHETVERPGYRAWAGPKARRRRRVGFGLTDKRFGTRRVLYEVDHCIYCHERDTDSCAKGMRQKKDNTYKHNPLGVPLTGCPLEEKISEMHLVKRQGDNIGALALIMIDNPMCPGTGHRICNDCMKGCIYQKTEPVNIPQVETHVLTDVLFMPYGFELYSLLTRWNPLNVKRPYALPYNGKKVLIAGLGPAGYTLAHYLLNEGFAVAGIDGLKIEPLPAELTGAGRLWPEPIEDFSTLYEDLDQRIMLGFGGVAEYGITARWDKNFLKVIYLTLARRRAFRVYGGVRFGGTLTLEDAWDLGFDHIAIAAGAGQPTLIDLKNNLIRGIRKASDFLMALQLSGAAKASSLANLQVRLPAGVIGGGLTAIDTATELLAYYPVQVEKILRRYETLSARYGEAAVRARFDEEERRILDEFLAHGRAIQAERRRAQQAGEAPDFLPLLQRWGGVTLFYRKSIEQSPAYRQNHEEIKEALDEGIVLAEGLNPLEAVPDADGHLKAVRFERLNPAGGDEVQDLLEVPLKSLFIAAGTSPNTLYEREHPNSFAMEGKFYRRFEPAWLKGEPILAPVDDTPWPKIGRPAPFTSYQKDGRFITFYGDNHPVYAGNVVKAMASAKHGYPYLVKLFEQYLKALDPAEQAQRDLALRDFQARLDEALTARIVAIHRLTPSIVEVIVKAPLQAKQFQPGQFYRVQNFETFAPVLDDTVLAAEGLALTGAWVDKEKGLIALIALEMGSSSRLCALWQPGDPLVVMGVTGAPTDIPAGKTVALVGGGLGNAVLFSIGQALRAAGNRVLYFAGYKRRADVFKVQALEQASDLIVWSVDKAPAIAPTRPQDKTFVGNLVEAMGAYAEGALGAAPIPLEDVDQLIVIGSDRLMAAVQEARQGVLAPYLTKQPIAIGSINSPMQCMMKGVCAQCLCKHRDPATGQDYFVYSCANQDQALERVDFAHLNARLKQNAVQEKLSDLWLDYLLNKRSERRLSADRKVDGY